MFSFSIGDKVSIDFNIQSEEETARFEVANAASKARVEQGKHQTVAETGTVCYLVNVDSALLPKGRQRNIPEADLTLV